MALGTRKRWAAGVYLAACTVVAAMVMLLQPQPSENLFLVLVLITFPVGAVMWAGSYFLSAIFPLGDTSPWPSIVLFATWLLFTAAQTALVLTVLHLVRKDRGSSDPARR